MFRFAAFIHRTLLGCLVVLTLATAALAQQAPLVGIDPIRAALDQIEQTSRQTGLGVQALTDLSQRISPLRDQMREKLTDLEPRLADLDARLKGLGAAPAKDAPAEDPQIAAERGRLTQQRGEVDAAIKQVQLLQTRAEQLSSALGERRRSAYAETMFRRSPNVLDPYFWRDVAAAAPGYIGRVTQLGRDGITHAREKGGPARMAFAAFAIAGLAVFAFGLMRWWRRVDPVHRVEVRYGKGLAALLVFARGALAVSLATFLVLLVLDQFEILPPSYDRIIRNLIVGVAIAALARAAANSVLAPDAPSRRLVSFDDATSQWLSSHLSLGGVLFGIFIVWRALNRTIGPVSPVDDAARMIFAISIVAVLVHLLIARRESEEDEATARRIPGVRLLAWAAVAIIAGALLTGYAGFASFFAGRIVFTLTLVATLYLLLIVTDAVISRTLSPDTSGGRKIARQIGVEPRRLGLFGKLASGVVRIFFVLVVLALAIGRWEVAAADLLEALKGVALGVRIGDFTLSFGAVFGAVAFFVIVVVLTRLLQRWLEKEVMPYTAIEPSLQLSIVTILGYIGFIVAIVLALGELGIDPQKIALVAGALSVGIGFGLQSIVSNFVSGLILLAERPIRVGDQIVVKGDEGIVRRISVRATEIETFDKASVLVPNSELITGVVKNWTHANTLGRVNIKVAVGYDADAEKVMQILGACVAAHPGVLKEPAPAILLTEMGSTSLIFEVFCIVPNLGERGRVKSDIQIAMLRAFREAGIVLSPPQDVRLVGGAAPAAAPSGT
jgi:potassium efflux system protein